MTGDCRVPQIHVGIRPRYATLMETVEAGAAYAAQLYRPARVILLVYSTIKAPFIFPWPSPQTCEQR